MQPIHALKIHVFTQLLRGYSSSPSSKLLWVEADIPDMGTRGIYENQQATWMVVQLIKWYDWQIFPVLMKRHLALSANLSIQAIANQEKIFVMFSSPGTVGSRHSHPDGLCCSQVPLGRKNL